MKDLILIHLNDVVILSLGVLGFWGFGVLGIWRRSSRVTTTVSTNDTLIINRKLSESRLSVSNY